MLNHSRVAAIAALLLAILFPLFWIGGINFSGLSLGEMYQANVMRLDGWDAFFVLIGALEVYVYLVLRQRLNDFTFGAVAAAVLLLMAIVVAAFHLLVLIDVVIAVGVSAALADTLVMTSGIAALALLAVYTVLGYILSMALLLHLAQLPKLLSLFAVLMLVACVMQTTIIFGFVNLALFPVMLLVLAAYFSRGDHQVEVV